MVERALRRVLLVGVCVHATACTGSVDSAPPLDAGSEGGPGQLDAESMMDGAADDAGSSADASRADAGASDAGATWPKGPLRPTRVRIPAPPYVEPPCPSGSGTLGASELLLGQTHLTPAGWPFQTISANRPLTVAVAAEGSGEPPALTATARLGGRELTVCLLGPSTLPASRDDLEASTYRGSVPAEWVQPGLELEVTLGDQLEPLALDVKAENGLTLYLVSAELFGEGSNETPSEAQLRELLARLPVSYLDVGVDPFGPWRPERLLVGPRDDGRTPTGESASHGPLVIDELPHCSSDDRAAGTCTTHSGFATMSAVLATLDTFREANGVASSSTWYADLAVELGGGLAGGQRGTGDDTRLTMNHELGHAWGFPHWGAGDDDYPYEGVQRDNGGFGDRWALDQVTGLLLSPLCDGLERQSPMQRAGSCVPDGSWFDPYSDYEAARLLRMVLGASQERVGTVAYTGGVLPESTRSFRLPSEGGRPRMHWNPDGPGMTLERYDETTNSFVPYAPESWNRIAQAEVPVVMFSGALVVGGEAFFEQPSEYVGNLLEKLDPSEPADYAYLYAQRSSDFYWARDLNLRFTLDDGSVFTRLYGAEAVLREDGDHARFAFNLPAELGRRVQKLEVLSRPLGHYATESRLDEGDSAANYFEHASVLATWQRP